MPSIRFIAAIFLASIVALSQLEQVHGQDNDKIEGTITPTEDTVIRRARATDATATIVSATSANVEEEENVEKIEEDIALLKLDDKIYWNRFLQNSGSAPAPTPTAPPPTNRPRTPRPPTQRPPSNPPPSNPPPTNPPPTNPCPVSPPNDCINLNLPVVCGPQACEYFNFCFAIEAGFDRAQCSRISRSDEGAEQKTDSKSITGTITQIVARSPDLSTFEAVLSATDLVGELSMGKGPFTIFAPNNEAFERLGANLDTMSKVELTNALVYHAVAGQALISDDLKDGESLEMAQGDEAVIKIKYGEIIKINKSVVVETDIKATNGIIHVVDRVLLPEESKDDVLNYHSVVDLCHKPVVKFKSSSVDEEVPIYYKMVCDSEDFNENALEYCNMELRGIDGAAGRKVKDVCCTECGLAYSH